MKLMTIIFAGLIGAIALCWITYHRGFSRGYSEGSRDEWNRWVQLPDRRGGPTITGRRDMREGLDGRPTVQMALGAHGQVNNIAAPFPAPK
jgi:hypothetical protein